MSIPVRSDGKVYRIFDLKDDVNNRLFLCEGAKVKIQGKNFRPVWGLFNGAIGKIITIVFNKDKNPNHDDHPDFIVINFPNTLDQHGTSTTKQ